MRRGRGEGEGTGTGRKYELVRGAARRGEEV